MPRGEGAIRLDSSSRSQTKEGRRCDGLSRQHVQAYPCYAFSDAAIALARWRESGGEYIVQIELLLPVLRETLPLIGSVPQSAQLASLVEEPITSGAIGIERYGKRE
eukprot:6769016-Prymnesium_polylepis.1